MTARPLAPASANAGSIAVGRKTGERQDFDAVLEESFRLLESGAAANGPTVDLAILPRSAFGFEGARTLDEWTPDSLEEATGVPIRVGRTAADLVELSTR